MKTIMTYRDLKQQELSKHRFFDLINSLGIPLEKKMMISPIMVILTMNFRDMNKYMIRYDSPDEKYKHTINQSTLVDERHSELFLEDWRKLHLDDLSEWAASDVIWWLFLAEETEILRKYNVEFIQLCVDDDEDPFLRFAHSESAKVFCHYFFLQLSLLANPLGEKNNVFYRYFGTFHANLIEESLLESEEIFSKYRFDDEEHRNKAMTLSERMYSIYNTIYELFARYTEKYVTTNTFPKKIESHSDNCSEVPIASSLPQNVDEEIVHYLNERQQQVLQHPFYNWLEGSNLAAKKKLQRFIPLWIMDIMGYRDLQKYVVMYPFPNTEAQKKINGYAKELASHSKLFLTDWQQLDMDKKLQWTSSQTLDFLFHYPLMDIHRKNRITFIKKGVTLQDPTLRFWFLYILEASGYSFFKNIQILALKAEREEKIVLNYLAHRHQSTSFVDKGQLENFFFSKGLNTEQKQEIKILIGLVFDALERNLDTSLIAAEENIFAIR